LSKLPHHKHFFTFHGKKIATLKELRNFILDLSQEDFKKHVSKDRNDFAIWIKDILHKDFLAEKLEKVKTREETLMLLDDELVKEHEDRIESSLEFKRFIAKEFIYGMFFGLVLGLVLAGLII
jgi:hypothetical protein